MMAAAMPQPEDRMTRVFDLDGASCTLADVQEARDDALRELLSTREAERAASERHREATARWLAVTCGDVSPQNGRPWCTEARGHAGDHQNLHGTRWPQ